MPKLTVTSSPHIHDGSTTNRIMLDVIIALIPALMAAVIFFGPQALLLAVVTTSASVFFEFIFRLIMKRDTSSISDLTAVITGLLIALSLPANIPLWKAVAGAAVAIVIIKQLFGGLGRNLFNPAMVGHVVAVLLVKILRYPRGYAIALNWIVSPAQYGADAVTTATPSQLLADGAAMPGLGELFLGLHAGSMGETSILALVLGGVYLVYRRVISPVIPLTYIGTTLFIVTLAGHDPLVHLFFGALVFVAVFMATDYATSPVNLKGRIIFGIGCGLITAIFRLFGNTTEGVSLTILVMNFLVPFIERLTLPKTFGYKRNSP